MAAVIRGITAKLLIQIGADEPKEIGTIEIPIQIGVADNNAPVISFPPGVRGADRSNLEAATLSNPEAAIQHDGGQRLDPYKPRTSEFTPRKIKDNPQA